MNRYTVRKLGFYKVLGGYSVVGEKKPSRGSGSNRARARTIRETVYTHDQSLLLTMTEKWKLAMDKGQIVGAIFIDFQKAFDTVSHEILSFKLHTVGISGPLHQWLMNYLFDRYQYTEINSKWSALLPIKFGVPQESPLGARFVYHLYQ